MNVAKLNVLVTNPVSKISKAGKPYSFLTIQGLATMDDGNQAMFKYDIWPEKDKPLPIVPLGDCIPVYGCRVHWETANLEPAFVAFKPISAK